MTFGPANEIRLPGETNEQVVRQIAGAKGKVTELSGQCPIAKNILKLIKENHKRAAKPASFFEGTESAGKTCPTCITSQLQYADRLCV